MNSDFQIEGKNFSVTGKSGEVFVNDKRHHLDFRILKSGLYSLIIDGFSYEVYVQEKNGAFQVDLKGHLIEVQRGGGPGSVESLPTATGRVTSPMPGRVIGIKVTEGEVVKAGQGLVVVEAMKMENELVSPKGGKVTKIAVKVGQTVEAGQELIVIE